MNYAHLHLIVNHFPIVGNAISILLLVWAIVRKNGEVTKLALIFTILIAISGYAADFTGGNAFDQVKDLPGITEKALKAHAGAADVSLDFLYATGGLALLALFLFIKNRKPAKVFIYLTLILAIVSAYFIYRTGYLGGLIRHPEIAALMQL